MSALIEKFKREDSEIFTALQEVKELGVFTKELQVTTFVRSGSNKYIF